MAGYSVIVMTDTAGARSGVAKEGVEGAVPLSRADRGREADNKPRSVLYVSR